ncbi:MAG TPA: glycosyltransferase [Ignavibacteriaceae bacterium]|nr:glycosyltransferase [Ignavibacteriaceae bacterium]
MPSASVIISVYNRFDYLELVLAGFERQSFKQFEVIIADDGSGDDFVKKLNNISRSFSFPVVHLRQEDKGFRKNKILNKSIIASTADYLIFIDGDCIPHREFVNEHLNHRMKNICFTGRRVNLSDKITLQLSPGLVREGYLEKNNLKLIMDGLFGQSFYVEKGFFVKNKYLRNILNKKTRGLLGCNFSIYKKDFLRINGFDERYEAPSVGEDSDVQYRLELNGTSIKSLNNIAVQYHLYHKLQERPQKNLDLFNKVKESGLAFTPFGIEQTSNGLLNG